jgi:hypothetical protein
LLKFIYNGSIVLTNCIVSVVLMSLGHYWELIR